MPVVIDSTVLSNFAAVSRLDLLRAMCGGMAHITHEVQQEILQGIEEGYVFLTPVLEQIGSGPEAWLRLTGFSSDAEEQSFREHARSLGYGEASCLALAERRKWVVLTDDRAARNRLRREALKVGGTLGVLYHAVKHGLITMIEGNGLLARMIELGYHSPCSDLGDLE